MGAVSDLNGGSAVANRARANPLGAGPLQTRDDLARAVQRLYAPLAPHVSDGGARVRLGSFAAVFEESTAELEGFARPLYGIVPLTVGGYGFDDWDRIVAGLDAGTDPASPDYWGPVPGDTDQRMVEQAAIGLALAFCPERAWEPLSSAARARLVAWLQGIFEYDPAPNNWQFFRVLVSLGLERVAATFDRSKVARSLEQLDGYRLGDHWYEDGALANVDWYVPFAFHTYGLVYAAANDIGLGDDRWAAAYRERAAGFGTDFQHWFAPDGAAVPFGRSMTYRFAMASFWGALAWADVETGLTWGQVRGLSMRHLRWWADKPISDRDGVLSVGFTYDNRRLAETYNSAGSPYWSMKAFGALAAPADHPFWTSDEEPIEPLDAPIVLRDAGQVIVRGIDHAVVLPARTAVALDFPEQSSGKYRKFAYSSVFGFSGDIADTYGAVHTDSMLALTTVDGQRRVRLGVEAAGVDEVAGLAISWSTWHPWSDVRVDTVCWVLDNSWHGRVHRVRSARTLSALESGFAIGLDHPDDLARGALVRDGRRAAITTSSGRSAIVDVPLPGSPSRRPIGRNLAVNASLVHPRTAVPALECRDLGADAILGAIVVAATSTEVGKVEAVVPPAVIAVLDRIAREEAP